MQKEKSKSPNIAAEGQKIFGFVKDLKSADMFDELDFALHKVRRFSR